MAGTQSLPPPELPKLVAEQHVPIPSIDKETQRMIVVLSNASLETCKSSHGNGGRGPNGRGGDDKYAQVPAVATDLRPPLIDLVPPHPP